MENEIIGIIITFFATFLGATGGFLLKRGSKGFKLSLKSLNWNLFFGTFTYVISSFVFLTALRYGRLTMLFPIASFTYVWTTIIGHKYLDEKITKTKVLGIILIMIGVIFTTR